MNIRFFFVFFLVVDIAYLAFFFSWYSRAKCKILGGGVEYDMI